MVVLDNRVAELGSLSSGAKMAMKIFRKGLCLAHFFCIGTETTLYTLHVCNLGAPPSRADSGCWNSCSSAEEQTRSLRRRDSLAGNIASLIQQLYGDMVTARVAELGSLSSGTKMAMQIFVNRLFTMFATNASFLHVIANLQI